MYRLTVEKNLKRLKGVKGKEIEIEGFWWGAEEGYRSVAKWGSIKEKKMEGLEEGCR